MTREGGVQPEVQLSSASDPTTALYVLVLVGAERALNRITDTNFAQPVAGEPASTASSKEEARA